MARQRHIYETAFDCKVNKLKDDFDDLDYVINHSLLLAQTKKKSSDTSSDYSSIELSNQKQKNLIKSVFFSNSDINHQVLLQQQDQRVNNISNLSQEMETLQINLVKENLINRDSISMTSVNTSKPSKAHEATQCENILIKMHKISSRFTHQKPLQKEFKDIKTSVIKIQHSGYSPYFSKNNIFEFKDGCQSLNNYGKDFIVEFKNKDLKKMSVQRFKPSNYKHENKPIEFKHDLFSAKIKGNQNCFKLRTNRFKCSYSSTESITTNSSYNSMESLRHSISENSNYTWSNESNLSRSDSSHSSDNDNVITYIGQYQDQQVSSLNYLYKNKNENSLQNHGIEISVNHNNYSQKMKLKKYSSQMKPINFKSKSIKDYTASMSKLLNLKKKVASQNKKHRNLVLESSLPGDSKIHGSDNDISKESQAEVKCNKTFSFQLFKILSQSLKQHKEQYFSITNQSLDNEKELFHLSFDIPKLCRRRLLVGQDTATSNSMSIVFKDLPFNMPKLNRQLRYEQSKESNVLQTTSKFCIKVVEDSIFPTDSVRPKITLNLSNRKGVANKSFIPLTNNKDKLTSKKSNRLTLELPLLTTQVSFDFVDTEVPLERQSWYHGSISRIEGEAVLRILQEGSYLVRNSESTKKDYFLSLKSARGFMHIRIQKNKELDSFIFGQFNKPFESVPKMVQHFTANHLPIRGAEHMYLLYPVIVQLL